jgi:hypothetical protein
LNLIYSLLHVVFESIMSLYDSDFDAAEVLQKLLAVQRIHFNVCVPYIRYLVRFWDYDSVLHNLPIRNECLTYKYVVLIRCIDVILYKKLIRPVLKPKF